LTELFYLVITVKMCATGKIPTVLAQIMPTIKPYCLISQLRCELDIGLQYAILTGFRWKNSIKLWS